MEKDNLKNTKYAEHIDAVESHQALLSKLHLDSNIRLDDVNRSLEKLTLTLEEYLKVIGLP